MGTGLRQITKDRLENLKYSANRAIVVCNVSDEDALKKRLLDFGIVLNKPKAIQTPKLIKYCDGNCDAILVEPATNGVTFWDDIYKKVEGKDGVLKIDEFFRTKYNPNLLYSGKYIPKSKRIAIEKFLRNEYDTDDDIDDDDYDVPYTLGDASYQRDDAKIVLKVSPEDNPKGYIKIEGNAASRSSGLIVSHIYITITRDTLNELKGMLGAKKERGEIVLMDKSFPANTKLDAVAEYVDRTLYRRYKVCLREISCGKSSVMSTVKVEHQGSKVIAKYYD